MTDLIATAQDAAAAWGGVQGTPRLLGMRENAVFDVTFRTGTRAALRLHRPGYHSAQAIRSELTWTSALAEQDFPCPAPIPTQDGSLISQTETGQITSAVSWIEAAPIGASGEPFSRSLPAQLALYHDLGALIRRLHDLTAQFETENLTRPRWDRNGLLGDTPHWGRFWDNPALTPAEASELQLARKNAAQQLLEINSLETGLIHADILQENVLFNAAGLHLIDFDDSGFGYALYDLGAALVQHAEHPELAALTEAICDGYGCKPDLIPFFTMLRTFASCGWVIARLPAEDARHRFYADRALRHARSYLAG